MQYNTAEKMARAVVDACADCDICRYLMEETPCLVFPELYRLYDRETERGEKISPEELRHLVDSCSLCGLCPCPNVYSDLMKAKSAFISREGLKRGVRLMEDVERVGKLCGAYPRLVNLLLKTDLTSGLLKKSAGIHEERKLPEVPLENFPNWARAKRLHIKPQTRGRKVAYFAGCTGQYLFPDVPKAVVEVFEHNSIEVYLPEQKCCGIPSLLEGDEQLTMEFATFNVDRLTELIDEGFDIVCSCPTCGFMLKHVLSYGAANPCKGRRPSDAAAYDPRKRDVASHCGHLGFSMHNKALYESLLFKDDGYFAGLDAGKRMKISSHTYDLGEFLLDLHGSGELDTRFGPITSRMVYYLPCHLREQKIGEPYSELLSQVPGIDLEKIGGSFYCCGISGIMGFKRDFHEVSVGIGSPLMEKVKAIHPERLLCDCLSCRLQFNQMTPYPVHHPIEVVKEAYDNYKID
jgi:glycerol-3-phosphate dehydrogenase subunit C